MRYKPTEANLFLIDLLEVFRSFKHVFIGELAPWHIEPGEDGSQNLDYLLVDFLL